MKLSVDNTERLVVGVAGGEIDDPDPAEALAPGGPAGQDSGMAEWVEFIHAPREDFAATMTATGTGDLGPRS